MELSVDFLPLQIGRCVPLNQSINNNYLLLNNGANTSSPPLTISSSHDLSEEKEKELDWEPQVRSIVLKDKTYVPTLNMGCCIPN